MKVSFLAANYFKTGWRNMVRNKVYSVISIVGLSIGLTCCMLIMLYNNDEVSYDRFHENAGNIYRIVHRDTEPDGKVSGSNGITGMMQGPTFKREIPEIMEYARVHGYTIPVKIGNEVFLEEALFADDNFFSIFSFPLKAGNAANVLKDFKSVVLSEDVAKKFFGSTDVIGKTIELQKPVDHDDPGKPVFESYVITGIVPSSPQNSTIKIAMLFSMKRTEEERSGDTNWLNFFLNTFVVLRPGTDVKVVEAKMQTVYEANAKEQLREAREKYGNHTTWNYKLQPLLSIHLSKEFSADNGLKDASNPVYTKILSGIGLFMLVIACINFVNLALARSLKRAREIGVRKVIGGARKQLVIQFLGESFLLSFFSFALALLLATIMLPVFNSLSGKELAFSYLLNTKLIAGYVLMYIITSLLAGIYPAWVLSGFNPVQTLYNRMPLSGRNYLTKGLVVFQFTLTTFLIIATITIYTQFRFLTQFDLGYDDKNLVIVETDRMKSDQLSIFRRELMKSPSITAVTARQRGQWGSIAKADGNQLEFAMDVIDSTYLPLLKIPLVQGRNFSGKFASDSTRSVLVNETFMKKAGWKDLNNRQVDFFYDNIKYDVVGVVKDYHYASLMEEIRPQLFIMHPKYSYGQLLIKVDPGNISSVLRQIEKVVKTLQPFQPYSYEFKSERNEKQYAAEQQWKQIITYASLITIFISCIGLFGLATLAAEKRVREIGIRKVLGASVSTIAAMLSNSFLRLVLIATVIAFPVAWWAMNKWLQNYPYRIEISVWVFVLAMVIVTAIALFTVSFQAIKAAVANPVRSLRTE